MKDWTILLYLMPLVILSAGIICCRRWLHQSSDPIRARYRMLGLAQWGIVLSMGGLIWTSGSDREMTSVGVLLFMGTVMLIGREQARLKKML